MKNDDDEYLTQLEHERHMFAWTLVRFGATSAEDAKAQALAFYAYESPDVFHDEAWHWALLGCHGQYWIERPELSAAPPEYRAESERFRARNMAD